MHAWVAFDDARVVLEHWRGKALLVELADGTILWVPKSQLHWDSIQAKSAEGSLIVAQWLADTWLAEGKVHCAGRTHTARPLGAASRGFALLLNDGGPPTDISVGSRHHDDAVTDLVGFLLKRAQ